jgi:hypothetical protein
MCSCLYTLLQIVQGVSHTGTGAAAEMALALSGLLRLAEVFVRRGAEKDLVGFAACEAGGGRSGRMPRKR